MRQLGGWEEVVGAQEEEELWFLLPVADVLTILAPQGSVVGLSGHTPPFHLLLLLRRPVDQLKFVEVDPGIAQVRFEFHRPEEPVAAFLQLALRPKQPDTQETVNKFF